MKQQRKKIHHDTRRNSTTVSECEELTKDIMGQQNLELKMYTSCER